MRIHPSDNVEVRDDGQKYALTLIKAGENVIKYGFPIGHAYRITDHYTEERKALARAKMNEINKQGG